MFFPTHCPLCNDELSKDFAFMQNANRIFYKLKCSFSFKISNNYKICHYEICIYQASISEVLRFMINDKIIGLKHYRNDNEYYKFTIYDFINYKSYFSSNDISYSKVRSIYDLKKILTLL